MLVTPKITRALYAHGLSLVFEYLEDRGVLAEYAGEKLVFYQLLGNDGNIEISVQTGRIQT